MKYTVDEAHREIIRRAHVLAPDVFNKKPYVDSQRVDAIRKAAEEFYAEGHEIISEITA